MKTSKLPNLVILAALSLITIVFWIVFGILRIVVSPEEISVPESVLRELKPVLNTQTLETLDSQIFLTDEQIGNTVLAPIATATPAPTPVVIADETLPTESPTASESPAGTATPEPTQ